MQDKESDAASAPAASRLHGGRFGVSAAVWSGGAICLVAVIASGPALPRFWAYRGAAALDT